MRPGETLPVTISFGSDVITDLTANGVKLKGAIYVNKQPYFRYNIDPSAVYEVLAIVDSGDKKIARFTIPESLSVKFPSYAADINLFVHLTKANGAVVEKTIKIESLIPLV